MISTPTMSFITPFGMVCSLNFYINYRDMKECCGNTIFQYGILQFPLHKWHHACMFIANIATKRNIQFLQRIFCSSLNQ